MAMLERIKKRQYEGFRDLVTNLETTGLKSRSNILSMAILEDPVFMTYVMRNIKTFEDFLNLPSDEIEKVLASQDQIPTIFAKCIYGLDEEILFSFKSTMPRFFSRLVDELSYIKEVPKSEKEGAIFHLLKLVRKLQEDDKIQGFFWQLPPLEVFQPKVYKDGLVSIHFESGIVAAQGSYLKSQREGTWKHYYDTGKIFAEGEYSDGRKNGPWTYYFLSGAIKSKGLFKDDLKQGHWQEWEKSGEMIDVFYKDGVKENQSSSN
jgi:hypothetical protein